MDTRLQSAIAWYVARGYELVAIYDDQTAEVANQTETLRLEVRGAIVRPVRIDPDRQRRLRGRLWLLQAAHLYRIAAVGASAVLALGAAAGAATWLGRSTGVAAPVVQSVSTSIPPAAEAGTSPTVASEPHSVLVKLSPMFGGLKLVAPTDMGTLEGNTYYVVEQRGVVWTAGLGGSRAVLADLSDVVSTDQTEEGLLGFAPDPAFVTNRLVYMYYAAASPRRTVLSRFEVVNGRVSRASELVLLQVPQERGAHLGGQVRFGPDGMLYVGIGDGAAIELGVRRGQDRSQLRGTVLRIDVRGATAAQPYAVPPDNPFVGERGMRSEIWAYGLRNPWRFAFDRATGDLWLADVGDSRQDEIDVIHRGGNYGWALLEGTLCMLPRDPCTAVETIRPVATIPWAPSHCATIGAGIYRGQAIPSLQGAYMYSDYCGGNLYAFWPDDPSRVVTLASVPSNVLSFGENARGEWFMLFADGTVKRIDPA